ncbi:response regulator [Hymenobacter nivis]|uniref:DNA-binding response regulator n=1 Tax=Hymenobacter nivis TaxID=1850093 RepID=A0A502H1B5_9BACT|nr:response regulator transcription factor [Hymenobacter nivis]TPG67103.1 DNA-binding response regulator [Hymenobacter nivis]
MICRLLLVDDHPALTRGLAALFNQEPDLAVHGQFATGGALLAFLEGAPALPADVLLLDLHLPPPHDGLDLLPRLRRQWPGLRVLVFSSAISPGLVAQARAAGAQGFLDKSAEAPDLLAAIRAVHAGQQVFPARPGPRAAAPQPAAEALLRLHQLSTREREIIGLVCAGLPSRAIAARLSLAEATVATHRRNLMQKLGLHGVAELVRFAHEHGL